jgi:hypothetical protein
MTLFETVLPATFHSRINDVPCSLALHLHQGALVGVFDADGEELEVFGGVPDVNGRVFGLLRPNQLEAPLAVFRAWMNDLDMLEVEVDLPGVHDLMAFGQAERIVFHRSPSEVVAGRISIRRSKGSGVRKLERI